MIGCDRVIERRKSRTFLCVNDLMQVSTLVAAPKEMQFLWVRFLNDLNEAKRLNGLNDLNRRSYFWCARHRFSLEDAFYCRGRLISLASRRNVLIAVRTGV